MPPTKYILYINRKKRDLNVSVYEIDHFLDLCFSFSFVPSNESVSLISCPGFGDILQTNIIETVGKVGIISLIKSKKLFSNYHIVLY